MWFCAGRFISHSDVLFSNTTEGRSNSSISNSKKGIPVKKFLLKLTFFFALCGLAFLAALALYFFRVNTLSFKIPQDKTVLFIGDSHMEVGIDGKLIPGSYNFAQSGDPYFDQYFRLVPLLDANPQIKTVFITATPHSLAKYGDARIFGDFTMQSVVSNAFPL